VNANPFLGVFFHWLGGLAAGSFYVPYRGVRKWAWEVYWLVGGFFSWIIAPWILASLNTRDLLGVLGQTSASTFAWTWFWGAMWGLGGLTFGLTMRYLGMSLGMAVALGYCAAFGTLMPPIFHGEFASKVLGTTSGRFILLGVGICLAGIAIAGWAGMSKEKETTEDERRATIKEFNFGRGILVATFSGVMSACFAYALDAATPIAEASLARGTPAIWTGLPKLIVVLLGGFTSNFIWCAILNVRNRTTSQYFSSTLPARVPGRDEETIIETAVDAPNRVPLASNYFWSALAGVTWYMQFFCYTMGETQMGAYKFSSWTLHMASIIIFSSLWGIFLKEWQGSSLSTRVKLGLALATLILSTMVVGYGNYLGTQAPATTSGAGS
jgi:L-rhamnose-H+ transport protein